MNLTALTLCRNEARHIGFVGRVVLEWCDQWVVLLHACEDESEEIVKEIALQHPERVHILREPNGEQWDEMDNRQRMLEAGRSVGGTHFALVDGDEALNRDAITVIRYHIEALKPGQVLRVRMVNLCDSIHSYRIENSVWGKATTELAFADHSNLCWRPRDGYQYHHRAPFNTTGEVKTTGVPEVVMLHMQMVSRPHLLAKHAWYKMMERSRYPETPVAGINQKYNQATLRDGIVLSPCPFAWLDYPTRYFDHLKPFSTSVPWHVHACYALLRKHGNAYFAGLDLFGVV